MSRPSHLQHVSDSILRLAEQVYMHLPKKECYNLIVIIGSKGIVGCTCNQGKIP